MASVLAPSAQLKVKNVPQNPAKDLSEKGMLSFPLKFIGHLFSPAHTSFGVIPQAHSLNLRSLFGICVYEGQEQTFLLWGLVVWTYPKQGNTMSPRSTHLPLAFPFPH